MIPILINNRDLLHSVKKQVDFFLHVKDAHVVLVDNQSTYPPLLHWYRNFCPVRVYFQDRNAGPRGAQSVLPHLGFDYQYFFMVDPDLDFTGVPYDFLDHLALGMSKHPMADGAGLGLRLDDLPETDIARSATQMEFGHWTKPADEWFFWADVDTAGVLRRKHWNGSYRGIRSRKYQIRHEPWYHTDASRPEDYQYYLDHCDPTGTYWTAKYAEAKARAQLRGTQKPDVSELGRHAETLLEPPLQDLP